MKKISFLITIILVLTGLFSFSQRPFTGGNIVVYRVGDGSNSINTSVASKVFLDEYTPSGTLVQSILMPASGNKRITMTGSLNLAGLLTLSSDGKYLVVPGYDADAGAANGIDRKSVGVVDFNGSINSIAVLPNPNAEFVTSAASDNGINLWIAGGPGVEYTTAGSSTSIKIVTGTPSSRSLTIANGQLYAGNQSSPPMTMPGTGLPVSAGQTNILLPGFTSSVAPFQFAFADLSTDIAGPDVVYICSQGGGVNGGIVKYSLAANGNWISNGVIGTGAERYTGLTLKKTGTTITLFATNKGNNGTSVRGGQLISLTDNTGYNGTITGTATPVVIASIAQQDSMAFRGVALVPQPCKAVSDLKAENITSSQATISWSATNGETNFEYILTTNPTPIGLINPTNSTSLLLTGLTNGLTYYVYVRTKCSLSPSEWVMVQFFTICKAPQIPSISIILSATGDAVIKWNKVFGAGSYEYLISTNAIPPVTGSLITDTSISFSGLSAVTQYYVHVRSNCGLGVFSNWSTKAFSTFCFIPVLQVNVDKNNAIARWKNITNAIKYEYALTNTAAKPLSGTYTTDTSYLISNRRDGSANYFHVRSVCSGNKISDWSTIYFTIVGIQVYPNPAHESLMISLNRITNLNGRINISDVAGRMIKQVQVTSNLITIDTRAWSVGIYIIKYSDGANVYTERILKR